MSKNKTLLYVDLDTIKQFRIDSNILTLDDNLILGDNLDEKISDDNLDYLDHDTRQIRNHIVLTCAEGSIKAKINWSEIELNKFDLIMLRPGDVASLVSMKNCKLIMIGFSNLFTINSINPSITIHLIENLANTTCTHLSANHFKKVLKSYYKMREIIQLENFKFKEIAINGIFQICYAYACQWFYDNKIKTIENEKHETSQQQLFNRFVALVSEYHQKERTVTFYANKLCITPKYLSQLVVNVSGKYAYDIIRYQVISKAKILLRSNQYTVQQVADELSFSNLSFFCKYFRETVGISPKAYMQRSNL